MSLKSFEYYFYNNFKCKETNKANKKSHLKL